MKILKIIMMLLLSLVFIGCTITENSTSTKENEDLLVDDKSKIDTTSNEVNNSLSNTLSNKNSIPIDSNIVNITDLKTRNTAILNEYIRAIGIVKKFCLNNSLNLTYIEPISDRALKLKESYNGEVSLLLNDLSNSGAETVNYFTNDENLNVDLSIGITEASKYIDGNSITLGQTYYSVVYKSSIKNIDNSFKFKDSKLNEFRNMILQDSSLNYDKLNDYVKKIHLGEYNSNTIFLNKIDEDKYEIIRIENNTCYYTLVYDPLL